MAHTATLTRDTDSTSVAGLVARFAETQRAIAALEAERARLLADAVAIAHTHATGRTSVEHELPLRSLAAELATSVRVADRTMQARMSDADILVSRFAATHAALTAGDIDLAHARVITDAGLPINDDDARAAYESAALEIAKRETPGRLRPAARALAERMQPTPLSERHQRARLRRGVWVTDGDDGMADLCATLPAEIAYGVLDRVTQLARAVIDARRTGDAGDTMLSETPNDSPDPIDDDTRDATQADTRTLGEVRADVLADILLTGAATADDIAHAVPEQDAIRAHVQVTIPATTMLGADAPAELVGHGPMDAESARRLAGAARGWDRLLLDPVHGHVLAVDRYRPSDQQRRILRARDEHCRFPGCRQPTRRCDIDHTIAREHDGPTTVTNLAHLCRRHHTLKHHSAWRVRQDSRTGELTWTSPAGRTYSDKPARTLMFTSAAEPPPF